MIGGGGNVGKGGNGGRDTVDIYLYNFYIISNMKEKLPALKVYDGKISMVKPLRSREPPAAGV